MSETRACCDRGWFAGWLLAVCSAALATRAGANTDHNYAEAMQVAIAFFECNESGGLSPGNRIEWRGPAHVEDGSDVGLDLSGGWYDAGDHWKSNHTMAHALTNLSFGAVYHGDAVTDARQMGHLLNSIDYCAGYFARCVEDPAPGEGESFEGYRVFIDIGNTFGPKPSVHQIWCSPEVTNGYTVRESLWVDEDLPGADASHGMAAGLASAAASLHLHGDAAQRARAAGYLAVARKLFRFGERHPSVVKVGDREAAWAPGGVMREMGYRSSDVDTAFMFAAAWLEQAERVMNPGFVRDTYLDKVRAMLDGFAADGKPLSSVFQWWRDYGGGAPQHGVLTLLIRLTDDAGERAAWTDTLEAHIDRWALSYPRTPLGLVTRQDYGDAFSLQWMSRAVMLAALHASFTEDAAYAQTLREFCRSQIDYVLGDNFYGVSYMAGYPAENGWWQVYLHNSACGAWSGFEHLNPARPEYFSQVRHTLWGGIPGGPNPLQRGVPDNGRPDEMVEPLYSGNTIVGWEPVRITDHTKTEPTISLNSAFVTALAAMLGQGYGVGEPREGFPEPEIRNESLDLYATDREFFVQASLHSDGSTSTRLRGFVNNRSRWPARITRDLSFRVFFTLDDGMTAEDVTVELLSSENGSVGPVTAWEGGVHFVEVRFPGEDVLPNMIWGDESIEFWRMYRRAFDLRLGSSAPGEWDRSDDWSLAGLTGAERLIPQMPVYDGGVLLEGLEPSAPCRADLDRDGSLGFFDVLFFLGYFAEKDAQADWDGDGIWGFFDLVGFLADFGLGCP